MCRSHRLELPSRQDLQRPHAGTKDSTTWSPGWVTPPAPEGGRWVAQATFAEPGAYVLRAIAHDGALATVGDVAVTVTVAP